MARAQRYVRDVFDMANRKKICIILFDEVDAIGCARFEDRTGENHVERTTLEQVNQLDMFDKDGNIKVLMATNCPDTLDPVLIYPVRLDQKTEIGLPGMEGGRKSSPPTKPMRVANDIRIDPLARLCPNSTGTVISSVVQRLGCLLSAHRERS